MITLKTCTTATAFVFAVAAALATPGEKTVRGTMLTAWGDNPAVAGTCNSGTAPATCSSTATSYGVCTVTFSNGLTADARLAGCTAFYYKTTP